MLLMKGERLAGWYRSPWLGALGVFILFFLTRFIAAPYYELSIAYMWDGLLDTCVKPWQFATGQPIAGGDNCYLSYLTNHGVAHIFGYSVHHLQIFILTAAALCMSLLFYVFDRTLGFATAVRTMAVLLVSLPFVTHTVLPTEMPTGLWGLTLVLLALTWDASWKRDLALAASCVIVLFCYGSGVVTVMPLLLLHMLFFRPRWPVRRLLSFSAFMGAGLLLVWRVRHTISGHGDLTHWGIGRLEMPLKQEYFAGLKAMAIDIFWKADSWYSGAYEKPYFNLLFSLLLLVALIRIIQLTIGRLFVRNGPGRPNDQQRWQLIFLLTFCIAPLIAGINVGVPGVRRIYTAVLLLIALIAAAPSLAWRSVWTARSLNLVFIAALCWEARSSSRLIKTMLPAPQAAYWFVTAQKIAKTLRDLEQPAVVIVDRDLEPALDRVFCRLYLDRTTRAKATDFYGIEFSNQGQVLLSKNGERDQPGTPALEQGFLLVTKNQRRADLFLPILIARAPSSQTWKKVLLISLP
jgi:hypothetical protein